MATNKKYTVAFRRKREGRTDYKKRLQLLLSRKVRLVVRRTLKNIVAQLVQYEDDGDKVLMTVKSNDLKKFGLPVVNGNVPTAYLTGYLLGKKALEAKVTQAVVDAGLQKLTHESRLFGVMKGVVDAGLDVHATDKHFPSDDRVNGSHIESFAASLKESNEEAFKRQFSGYLAAKVDPTSISKTFADVKSKIDG